MPRVFISYKRADKDKVFPLKDKIEAAIGEPCWIDLDGIESDAQFVNVIMQAIDDAEIFLFMYSKEHTCIKDYEKDWTVREINYAQDQGKRIVFINIDKTPLTKWFKFMFGLKQQVDATSYETFKAMLRDLQKWLCIVPTRCKINKEKSVENLNSTVNIVSNNKLQEEHFDTGSPNTIHKKNAYQSQTKRPVLYVFIGCLIVFMLAIIIGVSSLNKPDQNQEQDSIISCNLDSMQKSENEELPIDSLYYGTKGLEYKYDYKTMTASVRIGKAYSYQIVIPERVIYKDTIFIVNCIADSAFFKGSITSITLPKSIIKIGDYAFYNCEGLTSINIPAGVKSIGDYAFNGCDGLTSINIPASVKSIGDYAFSGIKISTIDVPAKVNSIGKGAFLLIPNVKYFGKATGKPWGARSVNGYNEDGLIYSDKTKKVLLACIYSYSSQNLLIPNTVTHINERAFFGCRNIKRIEIPSGVTNIGEGAFFACGITSVSLPEGLSTVEESTFSSSSLFSVEIPNGVKCIGHQAFSFCMHLERVKIPKSVQSIESYAFSCCRNLKSIAIPYHTKIGKEAIPEKCKITLY